MRVGYFDCFSGIAGDMTLGALVHLGVPIARLRELPATLGLTGVEVTATERTVNGIAGVKVAVIDHQASTRSGHRSFADIERMLAAASLDAGVRDRALAIFRTLAEAEGRVHGIAPAAVHFHEVGAVDSLVDIVGTALGVTHLALDTLYASPLPMGRGIARTQHGPLPVPTPATLEILRGWPVRFEDGDAELVTPTGAAIVATLATAARLPALRVTGVGYGCGDWVLQDRPNLLRFVVGEPAVAATDDEVVCIEANIDDLPAELLGHAMERLLAAGARDVFLTPIQMKKNRPGTLLRLLAAPADRDRLAALVFQETSTIGLRYSTWQRQTLERETVQVETPYGLVAVRVARTPDGTPNVAPEYESCRQVAAARGVSAKLVYQAAIAAYRAPAGGR